MNFAATMAECSGGESASIGEASPMWSTSPSEEWAAMSLEEQEEAMRQVNAELDDEMGEEPDWDNSALKALGARN